MKNPFQYLQDRRESEEAERRRKEKEEQETEERVRQERDRAFDQYSETVTRVLGFLREAGYPEYKLVTGREGWFIEDTYRVCRDEHVTRFGPSVGLVFDEHNQPTHFECVLPKASFHKGEWQKKSVRCGLTESELVTALKSLHP